MNEAFGILPELWRLAGADPAVFESAKQAPRRAAPAAGAPSSGSATCRPGSNH